MHPCCSKLQGCLSYGCIIFQCVRVPSVRGHLGVVSTLWLLYIVLQGTWEFYRLRLAVLKNDAWWTVVPVIQTRVTAVQAPYSCPLSLGLTTGLLLR